MISRIKRKITDKKGFTITESILSILIVSLSGLIIAGSICIGARAYKTVSVKSDACELLDLYSESVRRIIAASDRIDFTTPNTANTDYLFKVQDYGGLTGRFDTVNGIIVIRFVDINDRYVSDTDSIMQIVPARQHFDPYGEGVMFTADLDIKYDDGIYYVTVYIKSDDYETEREFKVIPAKNFMKG